MQIEFDLAFPDIESDVLWSCKLIIPSKIENKIN